MDEKTLRLLIKKQVEEDKLNIKKCKNDCGRDGIKHWSNGSLLCEKCYNEWYEKHNPKIDDNDFVMITGR